MIKDPSDEKAERDLMALHAQREELVKNLKFAPGDRVAIGHAMLRDIDAEIELREEMEADLQQVRDKLDLARQKRRKGQIKLLATLNQIDTDPAVPQKMSSALIEARAAILEFLHDDAKKRGIADDDH